MYVPLFADIITAERWLMIMSKAVLSNFFDLLRYKCLYSGTRKYSGIKYRNKLWI